MSTMERILRLMADKKASDVYLSAHSPALIKINGQAMPINSQVLPADAPLTLLAEVLPPDRIEELKELGELNMALPMKGVGNFRISGFKQRGTFAAVIRFIPSEIPPLESLNVPPILAELIMEKRGLLLMVGSTGAGKSTTLAAMMDHRNAKSLGHILTIEDPVEFLFTNKKSVVNQREVGSDTQSLQLALKNALRQAPDVILIGEIRDAETMEHAIAFAETGHLCLGTLHANSASQTIERIINFFPEERRAQLLMDLSANLRGIVSQRLVRREDGKGRSAAIEILLNTPTIAERIFQGEFHEIKAIMTKSRELGMRTFDWALFELYNEGLISFEEAIRNADSANELRLNIKLKSARGEPPPSAFMSLSIDEEPTPEEIEEKKHQALHAQQEARRRLEDEQLQQLREKRRLAEGAAGPAR